MIRQRDAKGRATTTHGMKNTRFYNTWCGMRGRCALQNKDYSGKGIKVCDRWLKFENFRDDMLESYSEHVLVHGEQNTQIDRINYKGNYEPINTRWVTPRENSSNRSSNVMVERDGVIKTLKEWAVFAPVSYKQVWSRINKLGWSVERALTTELQR